MSGSPPRGNTAVRCGGGRGARGKSPCRPSDWRRREGSGGLWGMHTELERGRRRIRSVIAGLLWGCTVRRSRRRNRHGGPRDVEATSGGTEEDFSVRGRVPCSSRSPAESLANVRSEVELGIRFTSFWLHRAIEPGNIFPRMDRSVSTPRGRPRVFGTSRDQEKLNRKLYSVDSISIYMLEYM